MKHEILTLVGKNCITPGDGQVVYDLVHPELLADRAVVDFGVGIPHNVRNFQKNFTLPADRALEWAFQPGTTTRTGNVTGGNKS